MVYADIARNISNWGTADLNRSKRIERTEGHRVQCKADLNCAYRARQMGCVPLSNEMQSLMAKQEIHTLLLIKSGKSLKNLFQMV